MTMAQAKAIYKATGKHFFDRDTMAFWGSRIETEPYKNRCFVTSENNFDSTKRLYTVRQFGEDYQTINTVGEFQQYATKSDAVEAAKAV